MKHLTEQQIAAMAPNANAVANAKKIVKSGGFIRLARSEDDTYYTGECQGSGSSVYTVSVDFIEESSPVCRCSCPSRQFPCKHGLALLLKLTEDQAWETCEIPQTILDKRAKAKARAEKKEEPAGGEASKTKKAAKPAKGASQAARTKKLKKQLEGLSMAEEVVRELMNTGLGTLGSSSLKTYQDLAKQLGDYYLPGPERMIRALILQIQSMEQGGGEESLREATRILVRLRALIKKSKVYITQKLEQKKLEDDDSVLYEELGGVWTLERLNELGLKKERARLLQLSFSESCDLARKELVDTGWWVDVDSGEISYTSHYRPLKALKYVKEEDSVFDLVRIPCLSYYPGTGSRRVRWDNQDFEPVTEEILAAVRAHAAASVKDAAKAAKNELKNTLSSGRYGCLLRYDMIGQTGEGASPVCVLKDPQGATIRLMDQPGSPRSVNNLALLPGSRFLKNQVLFGILWYDAATHSICMQPCSVITGREIIRLLY